MSKLGDLDDDVGDEVVVEFRLCSSFFFFFIPLSLMKRQNTVPKQK